MGLLDPTIHRKWLKDAADGNPPDPVTVARVQYEMLVPWHLRRHFFPLLRRVGKGRRKWRATRMVSRGAGKSHFDSFAVCYLAEYVLPFLSCQPQNRRIIIIGRTEDYVKKINMASVELLIANYAPWLKTEISELWPNPGQVLDLQIRQRAWTRVTFDLTNGVRVRGLGWGQSVRGEHVYFALIDDLIDEENAGWAESQLALLRGAILPAIEPGGLLLNNGTPQTDSDFHTKLDEDPDWDATRLPAYDHEGALGYRANNEEDIELGLLDPGAITCEEDWDCLWPARMPYEYLVGERGTTRATILKYEREYLLNPLADDTLLVHVDDIARAKDHALTYMQSVKGYGTCYAGLDPSTLKEDETAIAVVMVRPDGRRQLVHIEAVPKLADGSGDDAVRIIFERIREVHQRFRPKWLVEANGWQSMIAPLARGELPGIIMDTLMLTTNKHQQDGWPMLRTVFASGDLVLPYGPASGETAGKVPEVDWDAIKKTDRLIDQIKGIRYVEGKIIEDEKRKNDLVSALFLALRAAEEAVVTAQVSTLPIDIETGKPVKKRPRGAEFGAPQQRGLRWQQTARKQAQKTRSFIRR